MREPGRMLPYQGEVWTPPRHAQLTPETARLLKMLARGPVQAATAGVALRRNAAAGAEALDRLARAGEARRLPLACGAVAWTGTAAGRARLEREATSIAAHARDPWSTYKPARGGLRRPRG